VVLGSLRDLQRHQIQKGGPLGLCLAAHLQKLSPVWAGAKNETIRDPLAYVNFHISYFHLSGSLIFFGRLQIYFSELLYLFSGIMITA
jgi:hypothetical protein